MKGIRWMLGAGLVLASLCQVLYAQVAGKSELAKPREGTSLLQKRQAEALLYGEYKHQNYKVLSTQLYRSVKELPSSLSPLFASWLASPQVLADMVERIQPGDTATLHLVHRYQQHLNKAIDSTEWRSFDGFVAIHQLQRYSRDVGDNIKVTVLSLLSPNMKRVLECRELSYQEGLGYRDLLAITQAVERYKRLYAEKLKTWSQTEGMEVYDVVEISPVFRAEGGNYWRYLDKHNRLIGYQSCPHITGRTIVQFVILPSGDIERLKILRSANKFSDFGDLLDFEALRLVLSMPRWLPARQRGGAVACTYAIGVSVPPS